jgi:transposase
MSQKSSAPATKPPAEKVVRDIRRATRKHYSAEDKIRIVLEGLRGEESIAALCRREAIAESLYYAWSKEFLEAGKVALNRVSTAEQGHSGLGLEAQQASVRAFVANQGWTLVAEHQDIASEGQPQAGLRGGADALPAARCRAGGYASRSHHAPGPRPLRPVGGRIVHPSSRHARR